MTSLGGLLVSCERPAVDLADSGSVDLDPHLGGHSGWVWARRASERAGRGPAATSLDCPQAARCRGTNRRRACDPPPYTGEGPPGPRLHPPRQDRCPWSKTLLCQSAKRAESWERGLAAAGCRPSLTSAGDIRTSAHPLSARWSKCSSSALSILLSVRPGRHRVRSSRGANRALLTDPERWPMHVRAQIGERIGDRDARREGPAQASATAQRSYLPARQGLSRRS